MPFTFKQGNWLHDLKPYQKSRAVSEGEIKITGGPDKVVAVTLRIALKMQEAMILIRNIQSGLGNTNVICGKQNAEIIRVDEN